MFSRLVAQSVRSPALQSAARRQTLGLARPWARGMAKNNRPQPPNQPSQHSQSSQPKQPGQKPSKPAAQPVQPARPVQPAQPAQPTPHRPENDASDAAPTQEQSIPFSSLPDITKGLPSTLEYETAGAGKASRMALEGVVDAAGGGRGKGELPSSAYVSSSERKRQAMARYFFYSFLIGTVGGAVYMGRNWDDEEERARFPDAPDGWGPLLWWNRVVARLGDTVNYYQEPAFEKLLPDPDPMTERPYTLCISLEDMLVHSEWTREHGWRVAKRPGVDYFIRYLSQYYELVLFTSVPYGIAEPLWRKMDPFRFVTWPLFREATKYKDGKIVKDLSYLNRDLSKVIIIDTNPDHVSAQPENAILLPKWTGDPKDKDLVALIPFLEYVHTMQYPDVRVVLKSFDGKKIPEEFARREAIARQKFQERLKAEKKQHPHKGQGLFGAVGGAFGLKPSKMSVMQPVDGEESITEALAQGKMLQDIARERGQRQYERLEKMVQENGEQWLKEEAEAQQKAQAEMMASMKTSFTSWFGNQPAEKEQEKQP